MKIEVVAHATVGSEINKLRQMFFSTACDIVRSKKPANL